MAFNSAVIAEIGDEERKKKNILLKYANSYELNCRQNRFCCYGVGKCQIGNKISPDIAYNWMEMKRPLGGID